VLEEQLQRHSFRALEMNNLQIGEINFVCERTSTGAGWRCQRAVPGVLIRHEEFRKLRGEFRSLVTVCREMYAGWTPEGD